MRPDPDLARWRYWQHVSGHSQTDVGGKSDRAKLGWKFALLTVLVCLVPYWSTALGVMILVPSLLVSAANTSRIWVVRTYGETQYKEFLYGLARNSKLSHAISCVLVSAGFIALAGGTLLMLCPNPGTDWGYWFALGMLSYSFVIGLYGSLAMRRLFKAARRDIVIDVAMPELPVSPAP